MNEQQRRAELAEAIATLRNRIDEACVAAHRTADEVRLLAVTKTFPAADAALLADIGMLQFAENREQEATAKASEVAKLRPDAPIRWHMVGSLQRNKARSVVRWAAEVQTVDSHRLGEALAKAVRNARDQGHRDRDLDVLIQVSLDGDPTRGGCSVNSIAELADRLTQLGGIRLRGLMAVAPRGADPNAAFAMLADASERLRREYPEASEISAGMSGDLESAIVHGSTCVRVGTALLGGRALTFPQ